MKQLKVHKNESQEKNLAVIFNCLLIGLMFLIDEKLFYIRVQRLHLSNKQFMRSNALQDYLVLGHVEKIFV